MKHVVGGEFDWDCEVDLTDTACLIGCGYDLVKFCRLACACPNVLLIVGLGLMVGSKLVMVVTDSLQAGFFQSGCQLFYPYRAS